jgi:hypothetical protein
MYKSIYGWWNKHTTYGKSPRNIRIINIVGDLPYVQHKKVIIVQQN